MSICKTIQNTTWGGNFSLYFPQKHPVHGDSQRQHFTSNSRMSWWDRSREGWPNFTTPSECRVRPCNSGGNNGWRGPTVFYRDIFIRKPEVESTARITIRISILLKCYVPWAKVLILLLYKSSLFSLAIHSTWMTFKMYLLLDHVKKANRKYA